MPHTKLLQEWTTIQTAAGATETVTQDEAGWLDLAGYDDVVIWSQIRSYQDIGALHIETSPTKDDGWFLSMKSITLAADSGPTGRQGPLLVGDHAPRAVRPVEDHVGYQCWEHHVPGLARGQSGG